MVWWAGEALKDPFYRYTPILFPLNIQNPDFFTQRSPAGARIFSLIWGKNCFYEKFGETCKANRPRKAGDSFLKPPLLEALSFVLSFSFLQPSEVLLSWVLEESKHRFYGECRRWFETCWNNQAVILFGFLGENPASTGCRWLGTQKALSVKRKHPKTVAPSGLFLAKP